MPPEEGVWEVRDGSRIIRFTGHLVAHVSSARPYAERWTEVDLYRTSGGEYLIARIGRSLLAHRPNCSEVNHRMLAWVDARPDDIGERVPCGRCQPDLVQVDPLTRLEVTRYSAHFEPDAPGVLRALGTWRNGLLKHNLLSAAAEHDPAFTCPPASRSTSAASG